MASSARIDELRKKFEENPRRYFAPLANEYRKAGEIEQAIAICREYLPQQPGHMSGHIVFGQALYEARQFDEAKVVFETALTLDPENLIALRHLGDIALILGDSVGARAWYSRVLEADPRNEEIQAQLATLDQAGAAASAPTPVVSQAVPGSTLSSATTVVMPAVPPPGQAPRQTIDESIDRPLETVTPESPTAELQLNEIPATSEPEIEKSAEATMDVPATTMDDFGLEHTAVGGQSATGSGNEPAPAVGLETTTMAGATAAEAPPLDSFSLEGLETTSMAASAPEPAVEPAPLPDLDIGDPQPAPERHEPAEIAADAEQEPGVVDLPMLDVEMTTSEAAAPLAAEHAASAPEAEPPALDLDIGLPAAPMAASPPEPARGEPAPRESGPFVTETMAELYLRQGHQEEALRVYRALLDQRPDDATLQERLAALEAELAPKEKAPVPEMAPAPPMSPSVGRAGPTIREVLALVALRRPGSRSEPPGTNGAMRAETPGGPTGTSQLSMDILSALFGGAEVTEADESAALVLAGAFLGAQTNGQSASSITGAPARQAASELSLDSVFGTSEPAVEPQNFSFDQFFSQRAAADQDTGRGAPPSGTSASTDDVAHFTQWLEGLKQR